MVSFWLLFYQTNKENRKDQSGPYRCGGSRQWVSVSTDTHCAPLFVVNVQNYYKMRLLALTSQNSLDVADHFSRLCLFNAQIAMRLGGPVQVGAHPRFETAEIFAHILLQV